MGTPSLTTPDSSTIAEVRDNGTFLLNWADGNTGDRGKTAEEIEKVATAADKAKNFLINTLMYALLIRGLIELVLMAAGGYEGVLWEAWALTLGMDCAASRRRQSRPRRR